MIYRSKSGFDVIVFKPIGRDRLLIISAMDEMDGFDNYFEFLHGVTVEELHEILQKSDLSESEQEIVDELEKFANSLSKM